MGTKDERLRPLMDIMVRHWPLPPPADHGDAENEEDAEGIDEGHDAYMDAMVAAFQEDDEFTNEPHADETHADETKDAVTAEAHETPEHVVNAEPTETETKDVAVGSSAMESLIAKRDALMRPEDST